MHIINVPACHVAGQAAHLMLSASGHSVATVSPQEALEVAAADIVVVDLHQDDLSGHDVLRKLRERKPGVRIVALSSVSCDQHRARALSAGASHYVVVPLPMQQFVSRVVGEPASVRAVA